MQGRLSHDQVMSSGTLSYANLAEELVSAVPEFAARVAEHLRDNDELLPHVLFGVDLVPFLFDARRHGSDELVTRVLVMPTERCGRGTTPSGT